MKDESVLLLKLIKENKSLNEISEILGLSNKQLFMRLSMLKNSGYLFDREYFYNGDIKYSLTNPFVKLKEDEDCVNIIVPSNLDTIRVLLTSDTHLGNVNDDLKLLNAMTDYCVREGIHIVFNAGDFFEGIYEEKSSCKFLNAKDQISYGLKNYPYDKSILNFLLLGNHDASFWIENGIDISSVLYDRRHDLIPIGYGDGLVNIRNYQFSLQHPITRNKIRNISIKSHPYMINLAGHSHKFKVKQSSNSLLVYIPTASKVSPYSDEQIPSVIDMQLKVSGRNIYHEYFQQFIFLNGKLIRVGEVECCTQIYSKLDSEKEKVKR